MKLYAQHNYAYLGVGLYLFDGIATYRGDTRAIQKVAKPVEWRDYDDKDIGTRVDPLVTIPSETAQMLMQQLWDLGFRPNSGEGSNAQVASMQKHIDFAEGIARTLLRKS